MLKEKTQDMVPLTDILWDGSLVMYFIVHHDNKQMEKWYNLKCNFNCSWNYFVVILNVIMLSNF